MSQFTPSDPPILWHFTGPAGPDTHYDLKVSGRPTAKSLRNIIRTVQLTVDMLEEEQRSDSSQTPPASDAEGGLALRPGAEQTQSNPKEQP